MLAWSSFQTDVYSRQLQGLKDGMIFIEDFVCPGGAWVMWYGITLGILQGLVAIAR